MKPKTFNLMQVYNQAHSLGIQHSIKANKCHYQLQKRLENSDLEPKQ